MRTIQYVYQDPLDIIWTSAARAMGIEVERDNDVFASWDGCQTLRIGKADSLDADDSLAQMIFHEICHALVQGPENFNQPDWGLENDEPNHIVREHACLRLQATLAQKYGLRNFLATTTDFRTYYDQLPTDPMSDLNDNSVPLALAGLERAENGAWSGPLALAMEQTQAIAKIVKPLASDESLWSQ